VNDISGSRTAVLPEAGHAGSALPAPGTAAELLAAISAIRRTARRVVRLAWTQQPLPPAQSELLRLAAARPGISVAEAARELHLAQNTVSTLVGRLTAQEMLSRGRDAADGRTALLTVTAKAQRRLAEYRDLRAELADRALAQLSPGDQQALSAAVPALRRLAKRMEAW
jgi:DNA-binding MarR family transcriptional regulator